MGSRTYEQLLGFGACPYAGRTCFVVTSRRVPVSDGADVRLRTGSDLGAVAAEARTATGERAVWLVAGAALARPMPDEMVVEELALALVHVNLTDGTPLFVSGMQIDPRPSPPRDPYTRGRRRASVVLARGAG